MTVITAQQLRDMSELRRQDACTAYHLVPRNDLSLMFALPTMTYCASQRWLLG